MVDEKQTLRDGIVVGLIGYAAVALFYSAFDFLASRGTLYTVNLLGKALFRGLRDPSVLMFPQEIDRTAVFLYNALHLAAALAIGLIVTRVVAQAEDHPSWRPGVRVFLFAGFLVTVYVIAALTGAIRPLLPVWSVVAANALAAVAAGFYLIRRRPGLLARLTLATESES